MNTRELLAIGEIARRSGVSVPTVRHYEAEGLIVAQRDVAGRRWFARHALRRIAMVRAGQRCGLSLADIREALAPLPPDRPPTKRDWARVSRRWHEGLTQRIEALTAVRDSVTSCIGCGCLSLTSCPLYNAHDELGVNGPGARRLPRDAR